jgi:hypothetical protein
MSKLKYLTRIRKNVVIGIQDPTLSKKLAPATRQSISSSLSRLTPSLSLKRSANLYAPPPVAFSENQQEYLLEPNKYE